MFPSSIIFIWKVQQIFGLLVCRSLIVAGGGQSQKKYCDAYHDTKEGAGSLRFLSTTYMWNDWPTILRLKMECGSQRYSLHLLI